MLYFVIKILGRGGLVIGREQLIAGELIASELIVSKISHHVN
jgi:hypothetical protein